MKPHHEEGAICFRGGGGNNFHSSPPPFLSLLIRSQRHFFWEKLKFIEKITMAVQLFTTRYLLGAASITLGCLFRICSNSIP